MRELGDFLRNILRLSKRILSVAIVVSLLLGGAVGDVGKISVSAH